MNNRFPQPDACDLCIIGSGFAGSLLAWIAARQGRRVILVDRSVHPRFAIGESSTPLADFLVEQIASQFDISEFRSLSRWGSWQRELSQLRAGKKRGFSYFAHRPAEPFTESAKHESSLLVAASTSDELSDTHWMRSDVDQWLCMQAATAGASVIEPMQIQRIESHDEAWKIIGRVADEQIEVTCNFLVDASGGSGVLGHTLGLGRLDGQLQTQTGALFGHFRQVGSMTKWLNRHSLTTSDDPFDADDAAQHHLLDKCGWMWMLRFAEGTTSVGIVQPADHWSKSPSDLSKANDRKTAWQSIVANYPTIADLMSKAECVAPKSADNITLGWVPRIGRLWSVVAGVEGASNAWAMLPGTAGIVDPLHSTGIAHGLYGVLRLAHIFLQPSANQASLRHALTDYSRHVVQEVQWIDRIVNCCYAGLRDSFELFQAMCSLYFIAAIHSERQLSSSGICGDGFLLKDSQPLRQVVERAQQLLQANQPRSTIIGWLKEAIEPWNDVGLMDQQLRNRIARSSAPK